MMTAPYKLEIKRSVAKDLKRLPRADQKRLLARIQALSIDPRPQGSEKLVGQNRYRLRQGNYRILYKIIDDRCIVVIVTVAHRRDVYRP
jgi:mRNA interferase RelE/StbE